MLDSVKNAFYKKKKPLVIIIGGPTSVGKTAISNIVAHHLPITLINGDSTKIYKDMYYGTNKCSASPNVALFDIKDPIDEQDYSCGRFYDMAIEEIRKAHENGKIPLIVGGSGLYLRWIVYGKQTAPIRDREMNLELLQKLRSMPNWEAVHSYMAQFDSEYANKIMPNDFKKAARIIEICTRSSKKMKDFDTQNFDPSKYPFEYDLPFDYRCFVLNVPRLDLYESIGNRCEKMIQDGLIDEVWTLMKKGLTMEHNAGRAIGYRQTIDYLAKKVFTSSSFTNYVRNFYSVSRRLAHRQLNWFRNDPGYLWIDATDKTRAANEIIDLISLSEKNWAEKLKEQKNEKSKYLSTEELKAIRCTDFKLNIFELNPTRMSKEEYKVRRAAVNSAIEDQLRNLSKIKKEMDEINYQYP